MKRILFMLALLAIAVIVSGCADYQSQQAPGEVETTEVIMQNYVFVPQDIVVNTGDTVTWTNDDRVDHTVTADNGEFDSGEMAPGESFSYTFEQAGVFNYSCTIHPGMIGSVTVQ